MSDQWTESQNLLWFVVHPGGQPALQTASILSRKAAIAFWIEEAGETWQFWYRRGMRARQAKIKWRFT